MIARATTTPSTFEASISSSVKITAMIASNAMNPSTAPYHSRHIPIAAAAITAEKTKMPPAAWLAGDTIGGKRPAAGGIFVFSAVMAAAAIGMWKLWYGAVLGFMALLAIIAVLFTLLLIEASNVLGVVVALAIIGVAGYLFFKLVRVLSRIQMPRSETSDSR